MKNNLPEIYSNNIFRKFFRHIRSLLSFKTRSFNEETSNNSVNNFSNNNQNDFFKDLRVDDDIVDIQLKKKKYMENLKGNLGLLEKCSNEELEMILKYYLDEKENKRNILKRLTN